MKVSQETARALLQIKAIKLNPQKPFTWASGIQSPIYTDNRLILSYPEVRKKIISSMAKLAEEFGPIDKIAGVATAGIAHGALLAEKMGLPFLYVRSKAKSHGRQNQIEGKLDPGDKCLVVEDLISTGGSALQAVKALRNNEANPIGIVAIFSYGFPQAIQNMENDNISFKTLSNYKTLIEEALKLSYISARQLSTLREWAEHPESWSPQ